ncbi:hypothetical protein BDB13_5964 [Rhodococcus sp. OK302]|nr:hypothetical protein BDB13_5964 [Rhodococcus sp. OK302]
MSYKFTEDGIADLDQAACGPPPGEYTAGWRAICALRAEEPLRLAAPHITQYSFPKRRGKNFPCNRSVSVFVQLTPLGFENMFD